MTATIKRPRQISERDFLTTPGQVIGQPFNYQSWYSEIVNRLPSGSIIVEVGVYKGRSASFLVEQMLKAGKIFEIHLVDIMTIPLVRKHVALLRKNCFLHDSDSVSASAGFEDKTIDFVWIDGDHSLEGVRADIAAWLPKVKAGGVIAGHDYYDNPNKGNFVRSAVREVFPNARIEHKCWWQEVSA